MASAVPFQLDDDQSHLVATMFENGITDSIFERCLYLASRAKFPSLALMIIAIKVREMLK
jgi:hypothetical protein